MTPEQFCYWLQGYFELSITSGVTPQQAQVIKDHLQLVLKKETPKRIMVAKESTWDETSKPPTIPYNGNGVMNTDFPKNPLIC